MLAPTVSERMLMLLLKLPRYTECAFWCYYCPRKRRQYCFVSIYTSL